MKIFPKMNFLYKKFVVVSLAVFLVPFLFANAQVTVSTSTAPSFTVTAISVSTTSCPLITSFMKRDNKGNKKDQVTRLQNFLNDREGAKLTVSGSFDQATEDAVKAFQKKYISTVMAPWGATRGSGIVHITTTKKINEIACDIPLSLNNSELSEIVRYKANLSSPVATVQSVAPATPSVSVGPAVVPTVTPKSSVSVVDNTSTSSEIEVTAPAAASVANTSVAGRFWSFVKGLFR